MYKDERDRREYGVAWRWLRKCKAVEILGGHCVGDNGTCGQDDVRLLEFDHVASDGYLERQNGRYSGAQIASWIIANPEQARAKYQVLCSNCHTLKTSSERKPQWT